MIRTGNSQCTVQYSGQESELTERETGGGNCRYEVLKTGKRVLGYTAREYLAGQEKGCKGFETFSKD